MIFSESEKTLFLISVILKAISGFHKQNQTFHPSGFSRFPSPSPKVKPPFTCMSSEMNIEVIIGAKILSTVAAFSGGSEGFNFCSFQTVFIFIFGRKYTHIMKSKWKFAVLFNTVTVLKQGKTQNYKLLSNPTVYK